MIIGLRDVLFEPKLSKLYVGNVIRGRQKRRERRGIKINKRKQNEKRSDKRAFFFL